MSSAITTSVGPLEPAVRDAIRAYRDQNGHPNYNEALQAMLKEVNGEN